MISIIHAIIYWTGFFVWITIVAVLFGITCLAASQWWHRRGSALMGNIIFGLFAPFSHSKFDYYIEWNRIVHTPSLHRDCLRRHNNCKRFAYKRLVKEAHRQYRKEFTRLPRRPVDSH